MIKSELAQQISAQMTHLPEDTIETGVKQIIEELTLALIRDQHIEIRGFGSFSLHHRAPRKARNPKTGETIYTKAKKKPHFKAGKTLKASVDQETT
jgi:integration host factor subunit beta